ncbi:hypothetical protein LCGC14_2301460, partial [marine sediment metagenome]
MSKPESRRSMSWLEGVRVIEIT